MTTWILLEKAAPPNQRRILCSCESFLKHSLTSDANGKVSDTIIHGIASVFCPVSCRRHGYTARMMQELARELYTWQTEAHQPSVASTLYSDIGKAHYAKLNWEPNPTNSQVELKPSAGAWPSAAKKVRKSELESLCRRDEAIVWSRMAVPTSEVDTRFAIIPDREVRLAARAPTPTECRLGQDRIG